jgi:hypothetical protein
MQLPFNKQSFLKYSIAAVWLINGLFCKVLHLVPRHRQIVSSILGNDYAEVFTLLIGVAEIIMAIWIIAAIAISFNTIIQITIVACMNLLEFILVPHLLLWGRYNAVFALLFIALVYYYGFVLYKNKITVVK